MVMSVFRVFVGLVSLTLGHKLFWAFVGASGFLVGLRIATGLLGELPVVLMLALGIALGLIGALLAVFLGKAVIGVAGFFVGGLIALELASMFGWDPGRLSWLPFLIGGVLGAVLLFVLFDWALIVLSSLTGASLIVRAIELRPALALIAYGILVVIGILIQAILMGREPGPA